MNKKLMSSTLSLLTLALLSSACLKIEAPAPFKRPEAKKSSNRVTAENRKVDQMIGDEEVKLQVISRSLLSSSNILGVNAQKTRALLERLPRASRAAGSIADESPLPTEEESLVLGFPVGLIGEQNIFGGVITKVSDKDNDTLGGLKLTDLSPLNVRTVIAPDEQGKPTLTLVGCPFRCAEDSAQGALVSFPIVGYNEEAGLLMVDLAAIGKELDLVMMLDPKGEYTKLKTRTSSTVGFDYSVSTLVFDIKSQMIPVSAEVEDESAPVTEFTVRWYLKLNSVFNPAFVARDPVSSVGYFQTERSQNPKITRFSITSNGTNVHYYIKSVPEEFRKIFAGALDNWNVEFRKIIGRDLLTYEFLEKEDPRFEEIVAGDIRFNVIEWDLHNKAGYGGLGPSIANQFTGETLSANVLIQGPTIIDLYTKWFGVSEKARELKAQGLAREARELMKAFNQNAEKKLAARSSVKFSLKLGSLLTMNVHSQRQELQDPIYKGHFEVVPAGITYDEYMTGYFTEMLEHELGHNLGLRHNFKGNLGAFETGAKGSVSRSIMEYLGRPYRHLNAIGLYDKMAIAYGYKGVTPKHHNWFCTDEDQASDAKSLLVKSPECSKSDATSDPFSFWEGRLDRALELLLDPKSSAAPIWNVSELKELEDAILGLSAYALSAEKTSATWTNFFGKGDRPEDASQVKEYVLGSFKSKLCNPELERIIAAKESEEGKKLAEKNLKDLRALVLEKTSGWELYTAEDLSCL